MLQRKVADTIKAVAHSGLPHFMGFMNERQRELAIMQLNRSASKNYKFYGGHSSAEREMLCVFENPLDKNQPIFPLTCVFISFKVCANHLTHRDYLGAILALGIKREFIGDILPSAAGAQIFVQNTMLVFIKENLNSIGRLNAEVHIELAPVEPVPQETQEELLSASVPSLRLDAVLAAMMKTSRAGVLKYIESGRVQINHREVGAPAHTVYEEDVFSIRGVGKFRFCKLSGKSRKNRLIILYHKY